MSRSTNRPSKTYDVIVFGVTGFTGQFVAEELCKLVATEGQKVKWAVAGRNKSRTQAVLNELNIEGINVLVADVNDQDSLEAMCAQAVVILDCVGPYQLFGEPVVKACISQKCNYVDITGETYYMETIEDKYDELARDAGIYIVSSCGFDSIPNDLGALLVQKSFTGDLVYVDSYVTLSGKNLNFNTGTWESLVRSLQNHGNLMKLRKRVHFPPLTLPAYPPPSRKSLFYSNLLKQWCGPFQGSDRAVVYRSMRYRQENEGVSAFKFRPYMSFSSIWQALAIVILFIPVILLTMTNWGVNMLIKYPRFFSAGLAQTPKKEDLDGISFSVILEGYGYSPGADKSASPDSKVVVKVSGGDPGYGVTSALLVQSGLCFVNEKESLPSRGGVYTPAAAFGKTNLIQNMNRTGKVKFEVLE